MASCLRLTTCSGRGVGNSVAPCRVCDSSGSAHQPAGARIRSRAFEAGHLRFRAIFTRHARPSPTESPARQRDRQAPLCAAVLGVADPAFTGNSPWRQLGWLGRSSPRRRNPALSRGSRWGSAVPELPTACSGSRLGHAAAHGRPKLLPFACWVRTAQYALRRKGTGTAADAWCWLRLRRSDARRTPGSVPCSAGTGGHGYSRSSW